MNERSINCIIYKDSFVHHRKHYASIRQKSQWMLRRKSWLFEEKHETKSERKRVKCRFFKCFFFFFFYHWHYSSLWALACRTMSFHFFLSATNSLHLLTPSTWRSLSTSSFSLVLGLPLLLVPSSSWVNIFLGILSSSILSRWPNQLILCPFIHFTIFSPFLISSSSRFVRLFHSPFSHLGPYILVGQIISNGLRRIKSK